MAIKMTARYCVTLEDANNEVFHAHNTEDAEDAMNLASLFYAQSQDYLAPLLYRKCVCVTVFKRDDNGDYNSIASFAR